MTGLRRNTVANLAGRLITALIWIWATPIVLSRLGTERFGIWALFFAFSGYLIWLDLGVGNTIVRFIAAQRPMNDRQALMGTLRWGLGVALGMGVIWLVVIAVLRQWIAHAFHVPVAMIPEALDALLIFGIGILLMFPAQILMAALLGFERLDLSNTCMVLGILAHVLVLYLALKAGAGIRGAAVAGVVGQAVTGGLAVIMVRGRLREVGPGQAGSGPHWRDLTRLGSAFQVLGVLIMLQNYSGRMVLGFLGNLSMVAEYELALRVAFAVYGLPILIQSAVVPTVSRVVESEGREAVEVLYASTSRWIYTITVICLGSLWVLAPDIARVWLGPGHERIGYLIRIWDLACAIYLAYSPGVAIARGMGRPVFEIWSYAIAVVANIGLAVWWVPRYGTVGAIAAAAVSFAIGFLVFVPTFHHFCGVSFRRWFWREFAPRGLAGVIAVLGTLGLLALEPVRTHLPSLGWTHAVVAGLTFMTLSALLFLPLGDTTRLTRTVWQMTAGVMARRWAVRTS